MTDHSKNFNSFKQNQLAKIHIAKKDLAIDDDTYRAILRRIGNVESARDLTALGRARVLKHFAECGFNERAAANDGG